ncbi:hypothetical protein ACJMK2_009665 [Sinanodonta woodiana]|uniref:CCHC-type domain-containing protein n=1 Tax=Sinanodonta woodiana TaxID=1069815 RepID=A0ABD3VCX2_SINWO
MERKLLERFDVASLGCKPGVLWGYTNIVTGVRMVRVEKEDAPKIPVLFYVMGFRVRTWYRKCERDRKCTKCNNIGHRPWECKEEARKEQELEHTGRRTYAEATATIPNVSVQNQGSVVEERRRDIYYHPVRPHDNP